MPKPIPYKFRLVYFLVFVAAFLIGFPVLVFYSAGYTIDETLGLSIRGGIYVFTPEPDTSVYIGNELKSQSSFFQKEILVNGLKPGQYLVLTANDASWPWAKLVDVNKGEVESLFPLLVPKVVNVTEIEPTDSDYEEIAELFLEPTLNISSSAPSPLTATATSTLITRKRVGIWLEGSSVFAKWQGSDASAPKYFCEIVCTSPVRVFESSVPVRSFDFYPSRNDAIILALDNGVYAVEIDRREYQNFYPLYRGQAPDFRIDDGQVYIMDDDYIAVLDLDL